jgi:hypothetical protein
MNLYQYCGNNPVNWTDPSGLLVDVVYRKDRNNPNNGTISVTDRDTGESVTVPGYSGNRPMGNGDPIPDGVYDVLGQPWDEQYRLDAKDSSPRDDVGQQNGGRKYLRLHHPGRGRSAGCIAPNTEADWRRIDSLIARTRIENTDDRTSHWWHSIFPPANTDITRYGDLTVTH